MDQKKRNAWCLAIACVLVVAAQQIHAQNDDSRSLFIPAVYHLNNAWNTQDYDFSVPQNHYLTSDPEALNAIDTQSDKASFDETDKKEGFDGFDEKALLNKLPGSKTLKYTWDVIDGDVDLIGVENLRADWRNRGLTYKNDITDSLQFQSALGKDSHVGLRYRSALEW